MKNTEMQLPPELEDDNVTVELVSKSAKNIRRFGFVALHTGIIADLLYSAPSPENGVVTADKFYELLLAESSANMLTAVGVTAVTIAAALTADLPSRKKKK